MCVQCKTPYKGQKNCPKHVEFYFENKFEKLVHLVGFIIRIYHDARSPERQILLYIVCIYDTIQHKGDVSPEILKVTSLGTGCYGIIFVPRERFVEM